MRNVLRRSTEFHYIKTVETGVRYMWIDEDLHEPDDEELPEKHEKERQFERKQLRLANFLQNRKSGEPEPEIPTDQYMAGWRLARVMLCASELLEACKYSLTLLGNL